MDHGDTCVAYLIRAEEGLAPVGHFLESYAAHDSGIPHRFLVLRRGFHAEGRWIPFATAFETHGLHYDVLDVADTGYDLGAYCEALRASSDDLVCFLNTFSEVLCDGWLAHLHRYARQAGTGLVGATGSWESHYSAAQSARQGVSATQSLSGSVREWLQTRRLKSEYQPFPNPHVRTNGFMLVRTVALALRWGPYRSKEDAQRGESGARGLSGQAQALGLRNLVVGRDGLAYGSDDWPLSHTFRCGDQQNLMVADNRTRDYQVGSLAERRRLARLAWGAACDVSEHIGPAVCDIAGVTGVGQEAMQPKSRGCSIAR